MSEVYASDIAPEKRNDAFFGEGFEEALKKAEEKGEELVIGDYYRNEDWRTT